MPGKQNLIPRLHAGESQVAACWAIYWLGERRWLSWENPRSVWEWHGSSRGHGGLWGSTATITGWVFSLLGKYPLTTPWPRTSSIFSAGGLWVKDLSVPFLLPALLNLCPLPRLPLLPLLRSIHLWLLELGFLNTQFSLLDPGTSPPSTDQSCNCVVTGGVTQKSLSSLLGVRRYKSETNPYLFVHTSHKAKAYPQRRKGERGAQWRKETRQPAFPLSCMAYNMGLDLHSLLFKGEITNGLFRPNAS